MTRTAIATSSKASAASRRPEAFKAMVAEAGFVRAAAEPMLGGLVTIHSGWKI